MKRLTALILVLILVFSLAACGKDNNNDDPEATPGVETTDKPIETPKVTKDPKATDKPEDPVTTDKPQTSPEVTSSPEETSAPGIEDYDIGIEEDGENIIVTVLSDTPLGEAVCKMTYVYSNGALQCVTATYILPNEELASELSEALTADDSIQIDTIKVSGNNVDCVMSDAEIQDFKTISHDDLLALLELALSLS